MSRRSRSREEAGFTMLELMMVTAIIGMLASIALPAYRNYIVRTQVAAAMREVAPTKLLAEEAIVRHVTPTLTVAQDGYIGISNSSASYCNFTLDTSVLNATRITCTLKNVDYALISASAKLEMLRDAASGEWSCLATNIEAQFRPSACT